MKWYLYIFLTTVVHTTRDTPLRRRSRSLKVGSVVIENQTSELIKVYIELRNWISIIEIASKISRFLGDFHFDKNLNSISNQPKITMANTELIQTNSTKNEYFNHQFGSGFTTILPMKIREVEFVFHDIDVTRSSALYNFK